MGQRWRRGFQRGRTHRRVLQLPVAVLAAGLLAFAVLAPARADESFTAGSAAATANQFGIAFQQGGGELGFAVGAVRATYLENHARASSQTANTGFIGLMESIKLCEADAPPFSAPPPTEANTNATGGKPDTQTRTETGTERAEAYPGSRAVAEYQTATTGFPGIVRLDGSVDRTEAVLDPSAQTRTAIGDVEFDRIELLDGLVELGQVDWHVEQRVVGADHRSHQTSKVATFTVGSLKVAPSPVKLPPPLDKFGGGDTGLSLPVGSPAELESSIATVNTVLGPLGLRLDLPEVVPNGAQGVELTPMTIAVGGNTAYGPFLYPLVAGTNDTSVVSLFNRYAFPTVFDPADCNQLGGLMKASPELNYMWNAIGVATPIMIQAFAAALNDGGEFDFRIGGAKTTIDDTYYPRREFLPIDRPAPQVPSPTPAPPTATGADSGSGATPDIAAPLDPDTAVPVVTMDGDESSRCVTTSPVGRPGCWKGMAKVAAGALAVLTAGLLVTDEIWRRRRESELLLTGEAIA